MADYETRHHGILSEDKLSLFIPIAQGLWIKTHPCVADRACPACSAERYEPCKGNGVLPVAFTHTSRQQKAAEKSRDASIKQIRAVLKSGPASFRGLAMTTKLNETALDEVIRELLEQGQVRKITSVDSVQYELIP